MSATFCYTHFRGNGTGGAQYSATLCLFERKILHDPRTKLVDRERAQKLIQFACPLFLANLLQSLYNVVDMLVVGKLMGETGLAALIGLIYFKSRGWERKKFVCEHSRAVLNTAIRVDIQYISGRHFSAKVH